MRAVWWCNQTQRVAATIHDVKATRQLERVETRPYHRCPCLAVLCRLQMAVQRVSKRRTFLCQSSNNPGTAGGPRPREVLYTAKRPAYKFAPMDRSLGLHLSWARRSPKLLPSVSLPAQEICFLVALSCLLNGKRGVCSAWSLLSGTAHSSHALGTTSWTQGSPPEARAVIPVPTPCVVRFQPPPKLSPLVRNLSHSARFAVILLTHLLR